MKLFLALTSRCTAACQHCIWGCNPTGDSLIGRGTMSVPEVQSYLSQACALIGGVETLTLTGGEPFLLKHMLVDVVACAKEQGVRTIVCGTNAYWATSEKISLARLMPLRAAGLQILGISTDDFHQVFVPLQNVRHAVWAALNLEMKVAIKIVKTKRTVTNRKTISQLLGSLGAQVTINESPYLPLGAAQQYVTEDDLDKPPGIPTSPCSGFSFLICPNGDVYPCCSAGPLIPYLKLGNAWQTPLAMLWHRLFSREVYRILLSDGPAALVAHVGQNGVSQRLKTHYMDVCELCYHVLTDPVLLAASSDTIRRRELDRVEKMWTPFQCE